MRCASVKPWCTTCATRSDHGLAGWVSSKDRREGQRAVARPAAGHLFRARDAGRPSCLDLGRSHELSRCADRGKLAEGLGEAFGRANQLRRRAPLEHDSARRLGARARSGKNHRARNASRAAFSAWPLRCNVSAIRRACRICRTSLILILVRGHFCRLVASSERAGLVMKNPSRTSWTFAAD
jgi:hypothetical protein